MGFGKSFGLGLLLYLLLNFAMTLVSIAIATPALVGSIFTLEGILGAMLSPVAIGYTAWTSIAGVISSPVPLVAIFGALVLILPGLLGSLVAGKSSDSAGAAFGGWFLAPIIVAVIWIVLGFFLLPFAVVGIYAILLLILQAVTVSFLWGGIAAVSAGP